MISSRTRPHATRAPFLHLSVEQTPWISGRAPKPDQKVAALAFDGRSRYVVPFACSCRGETWHNADSGSVLQVTIVGWHLLAQGRAQ